MAITGIAHVQVAITPGGEALARTFYGGLLGLAEVPRPAGLAGRGGCWFACGPQEIHCGVEQEVCPTRRHPALLTDDIDGLQTRIEAAGIAITREPAIPGFRRFHISDPFGNRLEFLEPTDHREGGDDNAGR